MLHTDSAYALVQSSSCAQFCVQVGFADSFGDTLALFMHSYRHGPMDRYLGRTPSAVLQAIFKVLPRALRAHPAQKQLWSAHTVRHG